MFKIPRRASSSRYLAIKYFRHLFRIFFPLFYLSDLWSPGSCFKGLFILVYSHRRFPFICIHLFKGLPVCLSDRSTLLSPPVLPRHLFSVSQFLFFKDQVGFAVGFFSTRGQWSHTDGGDGLVLRWYIPQEVPEHSGGLRRMPMSPDE